MTTSVDIINHALELVAAQTTITALSDGTPEGNAAGIIYAPTVQMLLRQLDPDFARTTAALTPLSFSLFQWPNAYEYPADCMRMRQLSPVAWNPFDPQPLRFSVQCTVEGTEKFIFATASGLLGIYTTSLVTENQWDSSFEEAVVRQLANPLAMAIAGRPDFAREILDEAMRYEQMAEAGDDSMARGA